MSSDHSGRASGTEDELRVGGIDHVELVVPDREAAARWYEEVLGLETLAEYESWVDRGPLVLSSDGGETMLALFEGDPESPGDRTGYYRVAFGTDAGDFLRFVDRLADRDDVDVGGREDVVDHGLSYSVYFTDPHGYPIEITTYEYDAVAAELAPDAA